MIYRPRAYAAYVPKRRNPNVIADAQSMARCACRSGEQPCPRHAPSLYTMWGGRHRAEVAT